MSILDSWPVAPRGSIATQRLVLRPVVPPAARLVLSGAAPPGLRLAEGYPSRFSLDLVSVAATGGSSRDVGPFFVVRRGDRTVVGEIGCRIDTERQTAHVGYTIVESCWNRGYATEALSGLIGHLLHRLGVPRVEGETISSHLASRRVMEKSGMQPVPPRTGDPDRLVDRVSYRATVATWPPAGLGSRPAHARERVYGGSMSRLR